MHQGNALQNKLLLLPAEGAENLQHFPLPGGDGVGGRGVLGEAQNVVGGDVKILGNFGNYFWGRGGAPGHIVAESALIDIERGGQGFLPGVTVLDQRFYPGLIIHRFHPCGLSRILQLNISKSLN